METNAVPRAGRREWIGLAVLALPTLLLALDMSVLYLALPHLGADLGASSSQLLWIMDIYAFMIAGFLVTMGTLGDRIGRRRLLLIGAAAFGAASVAAAYSTSPEMLIASRALLGIAGATVMPSTLSLISNMFRNPQQRGMAIGVWMTCFMAGTAVGPVVGGVMLEWFWWGSVFLLGVPAMLLLLVTGPALLPEYRDPDAGRIDLLSVLLSLLAMLPIIYGLKDLAKDGFGVEPVVAFLGGLVFAVVFVRRQRTLASPLMDTRLFANRSFTAALVIMLLGGTTLGGIVLYFSQFLQMVQGLTPLQAGLWMIPHTVGMVVGTLISPVLARSVRPAYVVASGLLVATIGYVLLTMVDSGSGVLLAVAGLVVAFLGLAPTMVLGTDLIVGSAPPEKAGSASSLSETSNELGMALGVAVMGSIGTAVYRSEMTGPLPGDVPAAAQDATRDSLAGAVDTAAQLPGPLGDLVLGPARDAFTSGFTVVAVVSAA
ncbi:MAG: MFS transporter, partial [Kibdelosporangium sp.]